MQLTSAAMNRKNQRVAAVKPWKNWPWDQWRGKREKKLNFFFSSVKKDYCGACKTYSGVSVPLWERSLFF